MRKGRVALTTGAVLLLAAAAAARFYVVPSVSQVPADYDSTGHYAGTATLLNAAALATGDVSNAFLTNVPVTAAQRVKATSTSGSVAVMSDDTTVSGPGGVALASSSHVFAIDRKTLASATPPAGSNAEASKGLPLGFPIGPEKKNYEYWDSTTLTTAPATYTGTETKSGRTVYVYTVHNTGPVTDPSTAKQLPPALPKALLVGLSAGLPADQQTQLAAILPLLPDPIPLSYASTTDTKLWVDSVTGSILDSTQDQVILASMATPAGPAPLTAVLSLSLHATPDSVAAGAKDAKDAEASLKLLGVTGPIAAAGLALLLLILAMVTGRRKPVAVAAAPADGAPVADAPVAGGRADAGLAPTKTITEDEPDGDEPEGS